MISALRVNSAQVLATVLLLPFAFSFRPASAQFAVIDVGAIAQLIQQYIILEQQLTQAKQEYDAIRGARGMDGLLRDLTRNYLPSNWDALQAALNGLGSGSSALRASVEAAMNAQAYLSDAQLARLNADDRNQLLAQRRAAASLQAVASQALEVTSSRFNSIQTLINAIGDADDQKAILELSARIGAEEGMLENEQTKLQVTYSALAAQELSQHQRARELAIDGVGSLRALPPLGLQQ